MLDGQGLSAGHRSSENDSINRQWRFLPYFFNWSFDNVGSSPHLFLTDHLTMWVPALQFSTDHLTMSLPALHFLTNHLIMSVPALHVFLLIVWDYRRGKGATVPALLILYSTAIIPGPLPPPSPPLTTVCFRVINWAIIGKFFSFKRWIDNIVKTTFPQTIIQQYLLKILTDNLICQS